MGFLFLFFFFLSSFCPHELAYCSFKLKAVSEKLYDRHALCLRSFLPKYCVYQDYLSQKMHHTQKLSFTCAWLLFRSLQYLELDRGYIALENISQWVERGICSVFVVIGPGTLSAWMDGGRGRKLILWNVVPWSQGRGCVRNYSSTNCPLASANSSQILIVFQSLLSLLLRIFIKFCFQQLFS